MSQNVVYMSQQVPFQNKKKMKGWVIALIVGGSVLLAAILITIFVAVVMFLFGFGSNAKGNQYSGTEGYIAVLHIEGTIMSSIETSIFSTASTYDHSFLMSTVDDLMYDSDNVGIMLYIDTPGGEVYATDELYLKLEEYKEVTNRPIYAYCGSMAASGGYYIAATADMILMNRNCMTGSIGVTAGTTIDISGFLEKQGIKTTSIYVGKNKTMGSYFEEFTVEQQEIYISILQETYDQFIQVVADGRNMSEEDVVALADGRIYSPKQAVANGLVDAIMTYDDALYSMIEMCDLSSDVQFVDYYPVQSAGFSDLLGVLAGYKKTDLDTYLSYLDMPIDGPAYYYEGP